MTPIFSSYFYFVLDLIDRINFHHSTSNSAQVGR